jgi:protein-S-isoprenylcysteine O-methyltransferase Ste14
MHGSCVVLASRQHHIFGEPVRHSDTPGVAAPPPLIFFGLEAVAATVNWLMPEKITAGGPIWAAGLPLLIAGLGLGASAIAAMRRQRTPVNPNETPTALVVDGPYRFTRNPIYVGFTLVYIGFAALLNSVWPLVGLPLVLLAVDRLVIAREERWLAGKFGEDYRRYRAAVRRWL